MIGDGTYELVCLEHTKASSIGPLHLEVARALLHLDPERATGLHHVLQHRVGLGAEGRYA